MAINPTKSTGRPKAVTSDVVRKLEDALRKGMTVIAACHLSGISTSTYYLYIAEDQAFSDKMTLAQEWVTIEARQVIAAAIAKGNLPTAKWWLERKAADEFAPRQANVNYPEHPFANLTEEEIRRMSRMRFKVIEEFEDDTEV